MLIPFIEQVSAAINCNLQVDVIYTDFSKAFNKVHHDIILKKLHQRGLSKAILMLLTSYLSDRYKYVVFDNATSTIFRSLSGVSLGANLGPLLFLIVI